MTVFERYLPRPAGMALCLAVCCLTADAAAKNCDPFAAQLKPVSGMLQSATDLGKAKAEADRIANKPPKNDFHALYYSHRAAIGIIDQADQANGKYTHPSPEFASEIAQLKGLTRRLSGMDALCVKRQNLNRIFAFIGSEYARRAQFTQAECWLLKALDEYADDPDKATRNDIFENLGFIYTFKRQYNFARDYYTKAKAGGSKTAADVLASNQYINGAHSTFGTVTAAIRERTACKAAEKMI